MKTRNIAGLFLCVVMLVVAPKTSWGQNSVLYDDFNQQLLDPLRWATGGACYSSSSEMECVRTIQAGKLLLAHRNFGQQDSDTGNQFGSSTVWFLDPAPIKSITADIVIRNIEEVPCAANSQFGGAVHIDATFFNAGSGNSSDDVGSQLGFSRNSSDPKGQIFVWAQIFQGFNYFGFVSIGHVAAGSTVTATLSWDKANHQFIAKVTNDAGHTTRVTLPYSFSDSAPATNPTKDLAVVNFPANCTRNPTWVYTEATFDNVRVAQ